MALTRDSKGGCFDKGSSSVFHWSVDTQVTVNVNVMCIHITRIDVDHGVCVWFLTMIVIRKVTGIRIRRENYITTVIITMN